MRQGRWRAPGVAAAAALLGWVALGAWSGVAARGQAADEGKKPAGGQQAEPKNGDQPAAQQQSNPFPEDTSGVPVLPSKSTAALPEGTYAPEDGGADTSGVALPGDAADPVRSPDDAAPESGAGASDSSSSLAGLDKVLPGPDDDVTGKKGRKQAAAPPEHRETAQEDIQVGSFYLEKKNWRAALSRFESALVLDPENPDVFWGLAEAERHLGKLAEARGHYRTVMEYDPDSRHGKEARKALNDPEIANAKAAPPGAPPVEGPK